MVGEAPVPAPVTEFPVAVEPVVDDGVAPRPAPLSRENWDAHVRRRCTDAISREQVAETCSKAALKWIGRRTRAGSSGPSSSSSDSESELSEPASEAASSSASFDSGSSERGLDGSALLSLASPSSSLGDVSSSVLPFFSVFFAFHISGMISFRDARAAVTARFFKSEPEKLLVRRARSVRSRPSRTSPFR